MKTKSLILLSYGNESEYYRAIFSIISFFGWFSARSEEVNIIVYTDDVAFFQKYLLEGKYTNVFYYNLTPHILNEMLGETEYIHRRKVSVIDLTFKNYADRDVIFIDSDTFFIDYSEHFLNELDKSESIMHKREYTLKDGLAIFDSWNLGEYPKAFLNFITSKPFTLIDSVEHFSELDYSWNSGVLGISKENAKYVQDVIKLTDEFFVHSKWFISEQLAFSFVLQRKSRILPAESFVIHYWGKRQKTLMDKLIVKYLAMNIQSSYSNHDIKTLTKKIQHTLKLDMKLEQAVLALSNKQWVYGTLKAIQVILLQPSNKSVYGELFRTIKN